jgi:hypothetical protein
MGSGCIEVTDEVDTGSEEEVYDVVEVDSSRWRLTTDDEATRACSVSDVELGSKAMEVGEEMFGGRANVCVILEISDDSTNKFVAVEAMTA